MQALFSSFYANPCRDSAKPKMATNGGLKPFLGIFSCNLLLRFGEIPIFSLYNVAHFWKVCPLPLLWAFCFVRFIVKSFLFRGKAWRSCPYFRSVTKNPPAGKKFSPAPRLFSRKVLSLYRGVLHHGHRLLPHLPQRAPPSSSTALVERHRPCSSQ